MCAKLKQTPQRLGSQRRPLDDEVSQGLESHTGLGPIRVGREVLKDCEQFEGKVGEVENEAAQVGAREARQVEGHQREERCSVERCLQAGR